MIGRGAFWNCFYVAFEGRIGEKRMMNRFA